MPKTKKQKPARTLAYLRVSSVSQDLDSQKLALHEYARKNGLNIDEFVEVEVSSRKSEKARKIDALLEKLKSGDLLLVSELSRLGRSVGQIVRLVDELIKKGVKLVTVKEGIKINGKQDIQTKSMITMFSLFAEIERDLISERTKEGLAAARAKGKLLGRPKGPGKSRLDEFRPEIEALLERGSTKTYIAKRFGTSTANLHRWMNLKGIEKNPAKLEFPPVPSKWRSKKEGTRHVIDRSGGNHVVYMKGRLPKEIRSFDGIAVSLEEWHEYQKNAKRVND